MTNRSLSTTQLQVRLRVQLNTLLFAKTLVRKDIASFSTSSSSETTSSTPATTNPSSHAASPAPTAIESETKEEEDFSTKAQIMTLMTTDVDRVSEFAWHMFSLVGMFVAPCRTPED